MLENRSHSVDRAIRARCGTFYNVATQMHCGNVHTFPGSVRGTGLYIVYVANLRVTILKAIASIRERMEFTEVSKSMEWHICRSFRFRIK